MLAISDRGRILAINNQAYRIFQISTVDSLVGSPAAELEQADDWENLLHENQARERILKIKGKDYYVQYKHLSEEAAETGAWFYPEYRPDHGRGTKNPEGTCRKRTDSQVFLFRYSWKKQGNS